MLSFLSFSKLVHVSSLIFSGSRDLENIFVIVSEKVIRFVIGVDVPSVPIASAIPSATFLLPSSRINLCVVDNVDDGVTGGVGDKILLLNSLCLRLL